MTVYYFTPTQNNSPWNAGFTYEISAFFKLTAGLADGDTIVWQNAVTPSGITAIDMKIVTTQLDSNASPTGTFDFGDSDAYSPTDAYAEARYISGGKMGTDAAGTLIETPSNVAPTNITVTPSYPPGTPSYVVQADGIGYVYTNSENSPTNEQGGFLDLVFTVTNAPATAASSGTVWAYFTYYCVGNS